MIFHIVERAGNELEVGQSSTLKSHVTTDHQIETYFQFLLCSKKFSGKKILKRHVKNIHHERNAFLIDRIQKATLSKHDLNTPSNVIH